MEDLQPQTTLRDTLEANLTAVETGEPLFTEPIEVKPRDEAGRFAAKPKEEVAPTQQQAATPPAPQVPEDPLTKLRPTTWKKEYLPLWDKAAQGQPLSKHEWRKLAEYNGQRENEYKTGVSTYKAEAQAAKELQEAITPFLPELQANGIAPAAWVKQLGHAHYALAKGNPELKLQVFRELARQFNVPLGAILQQPNQVPPIVNDLLSQIAELKQQVTGVASWRQQQETAALTGDVERFAKDTAKYPHFELVRGTMAQLLESGLAQDLDTAYSKAIWMQDDTRAAETSRLAQPVQQAQVVAKARAAAVSPKSATPSGQVATSGAKDRRALLSEAFDEQGGRV